MLDWYLRTHSWNRIALTGMIVAPVAKALVGTLTLAHVIGLPLGALVFWLCGWTAIGAWTLFRRQVDQLRLAEAVPVRAGAGN